MSDVAKLPAGPQMDRLIAERVMGWTLYHYDKGGPGDEYYCLLDHECHALTWSPRAGVYVSKFLTEEAAWAWWRPSANIGQAWEVVERLTCNPDQEVSDYRFDITGCAGGGYNASFILDENANEPFFPGDTAPLAICRAALSALEHP